MLIGTLLLMTLNACWYVATSMGLAREFTTHADVYLQPLVQRGDFMGVVLVARDGHEGSDPGFAAFEARYPEDRTYVLVLSNLESSPVRKIAGDLATMLFETKSTPH